MKRTFVQNPVTKKFEERAARPRIDAPYVQDDIQSFVSPVDGSVINSKSGMRNHNVRHGVVSYHEFGDAYFARKQKERDDFYLGRTGKKDRLADVVQAYNEHEEKARRR